MFDFGFSELMLIGVVALVVLGPERLPKAARFAGLWIRRARAQWASVRGELERELAAEELKRNLQQTREAMRDLDDSMRAAGDDARRELQLMRDEALDGLDPTMRRRDAALLDAPDAPSVDTPVPPAADTPAVVDDVDDIASRSPDDDSAVQAWPRAQDEMMPLPVVARDDGPLPAPASDEASGGPLTVPSTLPPTDDGADGDRR